MNTNNTQLIQNQDVVVISDLHVGDPNEANLDDFRTDSNLSELLLKVIPGEIKRPTTLVINGDFIDFPQILPALSMHTLGAETGCAEIQSIDRMERAIAGHPEVFSALREFLRDNNQIIILPGNHDIDFHWRRVFDIFRAKVGGSPEPAFSFVSSGYLHEQGLYIEHGNQYSFDNRFRNWTYPFVTAADGVRLERPWGTFFMDVIYNEIEGRYPLVNKGPVSPDDLSMSAENRSIIRKLVNRIFPHFYLFKIIGYVLKDDPLRASDLMVRLLVFLISHGKRFMLGHALGDSIATPNDVNQIVQQILPDWPSASRHYISEMVSRELPLVDDGGQLSGEQPGEHSNLLGATDQAGMYTRAKELLENGRATVVAFGHTHDPVDGNRSPVLGRKSPARFFNTGSWTAHLDVGDSFKIGSVTDLDDVPLTHDIKYLHVKLGSVPTAELLTLPFLRKPSKGAKDHTAR